MGCSTCKSECGREDGCGERKAAQKMVLDALTARLYPGGTWGEPDPRALGGLSEREVRGLGQALSVVLKAPVYFRPGGPDDLCSFLYVLCLGREPPLLLVREEGLELLRAHGEAAAGLRERYLRVACSHLGRLAAVQEVAMELDLGRGLAPEGMAVVREVPLPGVFDPKLLKRFQKLVDYLEASGVTHLDMGLLDVPAAQFGLRPGGYEALYGTAPALLNYLFYAEPVQTAAAIYLPA